MQKFGKLTTCAVVLLSATIPDQTSAVNLKSNQQQTHALVQNQSKVSAKSQSKNPRSEKLLLSHSQGN